VLVQVRLAESAVEVDAARELHRRAIRDMLEKAARDEEFTPLERARYRRDKTFTARLCVQAVNRLFEASGGRALLESEPIQCCHRDINAASHPQGISWDAAPRILAAKPWGCPRHPDALAKRCACSRRSAAAFDIRGISMLGCPSSSFACIARLLCARCKACRTCAT